MNITEALSLALLEDTAASRRYGCLMLDVALPEWDRAVGQIAAPDMLEDQHGDHLKTPHVTVLYGFHDPVRVDEGMQKLCEELCPELIWTTGVSYFRKPEYDVLKYDVESAELNRLNAALAEAYPCSQTFPIYRPHMTIAYLQPGLGDKYAQDFDGEAVAFRPRGWRYTSADDSYVKRF